MTDIRSSNRNAINGVYISNRPITSDAPQDNSALVYDTDSGYWVWRDVLTPTGDVTITQPVTFDGSIRIGANGTDTSRLTTFVGQDMPDLKPGTDGTGNETINAPFDNIPRVYATLAAPNRTAIDSAYNTRNVRVDNFSYIATQWSVQPGQTATTRGHMIGFMVL